MFLDYEKLSPREGYAWMTQAITPRPIAWVSTISPDGVPNLAPFSFFQAVCSQPPTLMFVPTNTRDGSKKDTLRNIEAVPEFVVNLVNYDLAAPMNATAATLPYGVSEFAHAGVATAPSTKVRPPRVAASPVAFECTLDRIVTIGSGVGAGNVIFGRIVALHAADTVLAADGKSLDPHKLDLISRLSGDHYMRMGELFSVTRPA